jgi:ribosomal protein S18 acetylase RimI-like enzyme
MYNNSRLNKDIDCKRCSEVNQTLIYQAFINGYSDYPIPMKISMEHFFERFFGPEGNTLEDSFIALRDHKPVGLILGGIRIFDGYKNLRCGAFCVVSDLRGKGMSRELFRLFVQNGLNRGCIRISLEVLSDNERAIRFYEKQGFKKQNKLLYYSKSLADGSLKQTIKILPHFTIKKVNLSVAKEVREQIGPIHINWQNEVEYFLQDVSAHCFAAYLDHQLKGALVITEYGKIYFIYVNKEDRRKGIATALLLYTINHLNLQKLNISMPDQIQMIEFLMNIGFEKEPIEQYEMYKWLI